MTVRLNIKKLWIKPTDAIWHLIESEKVLKLAQRSGYAAVDYLGKYKGLDLYKPLYGNPDMATGLPVYIIVKDNKPKYVRGVAGLEIQKYRIQQINSLKSNIEV